MSPRAQQARRGAGAAKVKISGQRGGDKGGWGLSPSPVIPAQADSSPPFSVIPAKAGIFGDRRLLLSVDSRVRGNDTAEWWVASTLRLPILKMRKLRNYLPKQLRILAGLIYPVMGIFQREIPYLKNARNKFCSFFCQLYGLSIGY